jgi:hypothetical protein
MIAALVLINVIHCAGIEFLDYIELVSSQQQPIWLSASSSY